MPRRPADPMAHLAPNHVTEPKPQPKSSGVELVNTFFSKVGGSFEPGQNYDGTVLKAGSFMKLTDRDGNPLPIDTRWGTTGWGRPEMNRDKGYVPARIDKEGYLDPNGKEVTITGSRGHSMCLLVRPREWTEARQRVKEQRAMSMLNKSHQSAVEQLVAEVRDRTGSRASVEFAPIESTEETVSMTSGGSE